MAVIGALLYFVPLVLGFFAMDRLLSLYYTGSWWKQPKDVSTNDSDK